MQTEDKRKQLLEDIVLYRGNIEQSIKELQSYSWDYEGETVLIEKGVLKNILQRFVNGDLTVSDIYTWADFLELREDIDYQKHEDSLLSNIIYRLANPDLEGKLTVDWAQQAISKL